MVPAKHILQQGPVLKALGQTAVRGLRQRFERGHKETPTAPGIEIHATIPARPRDLVTDYIRHTGGDPGAYQDAIPAHMFPQWGFPFAARTIADLPWPLTRVVNAGCRLEMNALLPQGQPLNVSARLESLQVDERRVLLSQRIITGTDTQPDAVCAYLYAYIPLGGGGGGQSAGVRKSGGQKATVPADAKEIGRWSVGPTAGLEFALLTGDFNPIHWIPPYARAMGFRNQINHGFSTMARTIETIQKSLYGGRINALAWTDVKLTRPLVLPGNVGVYMKDNHVWVGDAPESPAYLEGSFAPRA